MTPTKCSRYGDEISKQEVHFVIVNAEGIVTRLICGQEKCRKEPS
jgi:hypothetical protein